LLDARNIFSNLKITKTIRGRDGEVRRLTLFGLAR
jgi:hypothetical protein